jgi:hypothetical protein
MAKTWVLDTETKGTGANVVPLEKVQRRPEDAPDRRAPRPKRPAPSGEATPRRLQPARSEPERTATALPPGHVRKNATGELGKVLAVDAKAGTATVRWLRSGASSTVPLSAVSRR